MCGFPCIAKPRPESRFMSWLRTRLFVFYGLYFRDRYYHRLRELLSCGLPDDPVSCGGKEEPAFLICVYITGNIVIVIAGRVVNFAPVVIVVGAVFIYDFGFCLFLSPQFYDVDIFVNGKLNKDFIVCLINDAVCGIR